MSARLQFQGRIAGLGSSSGVRIVVGRWDRSPLGAFADVMLADASGRRFLLAPSTEVAEFVASTYHFDEVLLTTVEVRDTGAGWQVRAEELQVSFGMGRRLPLGWLLRAVPTPLARSTWFSRITDPVARAVLAGVRTRGTAGGGRVEIYGATDLRAITAISGTWRGTDLGGLRDVAPEPNFGFGSTPPRPSVTTLTTTVIVP